MEITNIDQLKVGQMVWWYSKYGDLMEGKIYKLEPKNYEYDGEWMDCFSCEVEGANCTYGVSIQGNEGHIFDEKPGTNKFVDKSISVEMDCECGGTISGYGWGDSEGIVTKFGYIECNKCDFNQSS